MDIILLKGDGTFNINLVAPNDIFVNETTVFLSWLITAAWPAAPSPRLSCLSINSIWLLRLRKTRGPGMLVMSSVHEVGGTKKGTSFVWDGTALSKKCQVCLKMYPKIAFKGLSDFYSLLAFMLWFPGRVQWWLGACFCALWGVHNGYTRATRAWQRLPLL